MITAVDARTLLANNKKAMDEKLADIEKRIIFACNAGDNIVQIDLPSGEWIIPITSALHDLGFYSKQIHSSGIDVRW